MMLHEEGAFELKDPVHRWIPSFRDSRVYVSGPANAPATEPLARPMQVWHLMTHTSGLTYGFHHAHAVDEMYRTAGFEWGQPRGMDLAAACDVWAGIPLLFQPGTEWNYSVSVDVLGRAGRGDLGPDARPVPRRAHLRAARHGRHGVPRARGRAGEARRAVRAEPDGRPAGDAPREPHAVDSRRPSSPAAAASYSTTADYLRFLDMLRRGGELDGGRLLGPRTVDYMTLNHLPGRRVLETVRPAAVQRDHLRRHRLRARLRRGR